MKRLAILIFSIFSMTIAVHAQTYLDHIKQQQQGKGKVTITETKAIDSLVNGTKPVAPSVQKSKNEGEKHYNSQKTQEKENQATVKKQKVAEEVRKEKEAEEIKAIERRAEEKKAEERKARERKAEEKRRAEEEAPAPTIDTRKKVMRHARKVNGFRVQVYAGGNSRADRQRAQRAGNAVKMRYPDQPVYVHFYSPRWICRVGNYRSYHEAARMLRAVRGMGYRSATIVRGKITVFE